MAFTVDPEKFRFPAEITGGVRGKRVLISGAGKDQGLGQAFTLASGLNGAECVGVHFHRSYNDALDVVEFLTTQGVSAFPIQADVTNLSDLWASRSYTIERMGGKPPNLVICNSGLTEGGYTLGRAPREVEGESIAMRRARTRQAFIDNLSESREVIDTKVDGFLFMTHLWAGEAVYAEDPVQIVYISSRQAIDPGAAVPGYALSNWAVLQMPKVLQVNLGKSASLASAFSVLYPFVRTGMTDEYAENPRVFGRWQPRMLETHEAAHAFLQVLSRPPEEVNGGMFELMADPVEGEEGALRVTWRQVQLDIKEEPLRWSEEGALHFSS